MANTNLNPNPGPVAVGMNQGAPVGLGAQKASSIQQYDAAGNVVQVATTQPALALLAEIVCADTAGDYDLIAPFACEVVDALFNSTGSAPSNAGDTWKISTVTLAGSSADATAAQALVNATNSITRPVALNPANALVEAGGTLRITVAKVGHCGGTAKVWLIPTAL